MRTWILQKWHAYARGVLLFGLVFNAIIFWRPTVDVFNLVKITSLWITGIVSLAIWVAWAAERGAWLPKMRLFWAAGAFLAAVLLSTLFSQDPGLSLIGLYHRYGGLLPFALYAVIALTLVGLYWERPDRLKEIPWAITIACIIMTPLTLWQATKIQCGATAQGPFCIPWRDSNGQPPSFPVGTMGNSNFAGGFMAMAVPMFLYVVLTARDTVLRIVMGVLFAADLLALWYTQTRGAFIAVGISFLVAAFLYRDKLPRWVRYLAVAGAVGGFLVAVEVLFHPGMKQAPGFFSKAGAFSPFRTGTFQDRGYYWITALRIFRHHPILGTGPDTYYANYPLFRLAKDGAKLGLTITDKPHNIFLEYASNTGILGIGTYLTLVGLALTYGYRRVRQLEGSLRLLLVAFMTTLVAYLVNQFFSIDVPPLAVMGWVSLAGIAVLADPGAVAAREAIAAARSSQGPKGMRKKKKVPGAKASAPYGGTRVMRHGQTRWLVHALAAVGALVALAVGIRPFWADHLAHNGQQAQANQSPLADVKAAYIHAAAFQPLEPSYLSLAGSLDESQGDGAQSAAGRTASFNAALNRYQQAVKLQPENVFYVMNVARVYTRWGATDVAKYGQADKWWQRAVNQDPTDWQVHTQYAGMLASWVAAAPTDAGLRNKTIGQMMAVVRIKPQDAGTWVNISKVYLLGGQTSEAKAAATTALSLDPTNADAKGALASATVTSTTSGTSTVGG
jgi:cytochrome c-type biogenesis protein CcmH/NrfG